MIIKNLLRVKNLESVGIGVEAQISKEDLRLYFSSKTMEGLPLIMAMVKAGDPHALVALTQIAVRPPKSCWRLTALGVALYVVFNPEMPSNQQWLVRRDSSIEEAVGDHICFRLGT